MFRLLFIFCGFYLTLLLFGVVGLALSLLALLAGVLPPSDGLERWFQRRIHNCFEFYLWWVTLSGVMRVHYHGLTRLPRDGRGLLIAANHPGLPDITWLLACVSETICIFKPAIRRNPVLGAAARRAGYLASDGGHEVVRLAAEKLAAGHKLVVFPEGTRSPPGAPLLPFKPGFVLMAQRGRVPIQLVRIEYSRPILAKGQALWKFPALPADVDITVGPLLAVPPDAHPATLTAEIEAWFRAPHLAVSSPTIFS